MPKFLIRIKGENVSLSTVQRVWFLWEKEVVRFVGFVTTRFVEAKNANEVIERVMRIIRDELEFDGRTTEETVLELDTIREDAAAFDMYAPGGGYTFWEQTNSE